MGKFLSETAKKLLPKPKFHFKINDKSKLLAIIAAFAASFIYGVNHTIAKGLMPSVISPYGFILLRVGGAGVIFWVLGLFYKKETIQTKDWMRIIACAFFGMVLNMTMFFKGLSYPLLLTVALLLQSHLFCCLCCLECF